jgi:hypothetical protein
MITETKQEDVAIHYHGLNSEFAQYGNIVTLQNILSSFSNDTVKYLIPLLNNPNILDKISDNILKLRCKI